MQIKDDYILNLEGVLDFIFDSRVDNGRDSEITELYTMNEDSSALELNSKQLREIKSSNDANTYGVKYDLIKGLVDIFLMIDPEDVTFGEAVVINTLLNNELIKKIE
jgi:hypothetical protein